MALFSSFKIAPGVRMSLSRRGLRGHLGPRAARLHVGGGRTGVSTGAGPVTLYSSGSRSTARLAAAPVAAAVAADPRQRESDEAARVLAAIESAHRASFPVAVPPRPAELGQVPMFAALVRAAEKQTLKGIPWTARARRKDARTAAHARAEGWAVQQMRDASAAQAAEDVRRREEWAAACAPDAEALAGVLRTRFEATRRPVEARSSDGEAVALRVNVPTEDRAPTHKPGLTPGGQPKVTALNKTERAWWHRQMVSGEMLLAAKEAFALAPGLQCVQVTAASTAGPLVRVVLDRDALSCADWALDASALLADVGRSLETNRAGRTGALRPLTS